MRCAARAIRGEMDDMRYADPDLCPDCRTNLPSGVTTCPTCALPVRHTLAVELFATLKRAEAEQDLRDGGDADRACGRGVWRGGYGRVRRRRGRRGRHRGRG